ncbi:hypothetical protein ACJDT4_09350 [Clostridium neuense]|uniref:Uncharacterized protein n=1 Tax=Clostridium neuense TaxID=1728934 RepID=A0ABW8TDN9_9CLOT
MSSYTKLENVGYVAVGSNEQFSFKDEESINDIKRIKKILNYIGKNADNLYINMFPLF